MKQIVILIALSATATFATNRNASAVPVAQPSPAELAQIIAEKMRASVRREHSQPARTPSSHNNDVEMSDAMPQLLHAGTRLGIGISQITNSPDTQPQNDASSQAAGNASNDSCAADVKMVAATQPIASSAAAGQRPTQPQIYPGSCPLPHFRPLLADSKKDIDAFINENLPLMQARILHLQRCFYACVRDTVNDALLVSNLQNLQLIAQKQLPCPYDPHLFLLLAREKFIQKHLFKDAEAVVDFFETEKKDFAARYRAVDSAIESAGAMDSFNEEVNDGNMLESEGLSEAEIAYFQKIGLETNGAGTEEGSLVYWIECDTCRAKFQAGRPHHYYHKPDCRFYQPFTFNPNIPDAKQCLVHVLRAIDLFAHHQKQPQAAVKTWNLLHELRNSIKWNGCRWEIFLDYSEENFEADRQETLLEAINAHARQKNPDDRTPMQLDS